MAAFDHEARSLDIETRLTGAHGQAVAAQRGPDTKNQSMQRHILLRCICNRGVLSEMDRRKLRLASRVRDEVLEAPVRLFAGCVLVPGEPVTPS
jgi:hypothetical protein